MKAAPTIETAAAAIQMPPRHQAHLLQPQAAGVVADRPGPVREDPKDADLSRQRVKRDHDAAVVVKRVQRRLIVEGGSGRASRWQDFFEDAAGALEGPGDDGETRRDDDPPAARFARLAVTLLPGLTDRRVITPSISATTSV